MNLAKARQYFRLKPFDVSNEQGRNDERYRLAFISIVSNLLSKCLSMLVMILSVSLTIPYLGQERFGIWMTITSFVAMLSFLDLGIGNALTNSVAKHAALNDKAKLAQVISGGIGVLVLLGVFVGGGLFLIASILPWQKIIKLSTPLLQGEVKQATEVFSILFGINIVSSGLQRVFAGLQRAFEGHLLTAISSVIALILLFFATQTKAGVPVLLLASFGSQCFFGLFLLLVLIKRRLFIFFGIWNAILSERKKLLSTGLLFFILQIATMIGWGADTLIISTTLGVASVAIYSVLQKLFQFVTLPLGMINAPLWGAYADASARGEKGFIRNTLKRSMLITLSISVIGIIAILIGGSWLVQHWTSGKVFVPLSLMLIYGVWAILDACANAFASFMNGCNIIKPQMYGVISLCIFSIPIKLWLINAYGLEAMIFGFVTIFSLNIFLFYGIFFRKTIVEKLT